MFLQQNGITDLSLLIGKIEQINNEFYEVSNKIKKVDRILETLAQHLTQYENYQQYRAVYERYMQLDAKKCDAFYEKHSDEIQFFKDAKAYLDDIMNGNKTIPIKTWQKEQAKLTAERFTLCEDYYRLQDEVRIVELLRKSVKNLMRKDGLERQLVRTQGMELN